MIIKVCILDKCIEWKISNGDRPKCEENKYEHERERERERKIDGEGDN